MLNSVYVETKFAIIMLKVVHAEQTNAVFLTSATVIRSGIGPRNALSIGIYWAPNSQ